MAETTYIVTGMWGTSNLTLSLLDYHTGHVIAEKSGPGISMLDGRSPEDVLFSQIDTWRTQYKLHSIMLSGMVGSSIGWIDVPYLTCPIDLAVLSQSAFRFTARGIPCAIVPGLSCRNPLGYNDVMRGEETEAMSWMMDATELQRENSIICIPGTHAKWVHIKEGKIFTFLTSVVGEVYQIITQNGILAKPHYQKPIQSSKAFMQAVCDVEKNPSSLMNLLFTTRANAVMGEFTPADSTDYLSGLLIGADINSAISCFGLDAMKRQEIPLIGAQYLVERYRDALSYWGISAQLIRSAEMGATGLYNIKSSK